MAAIRAAEGRPLQADREQLLWGYTANRITQEVAHALKELLPQAKPLNMVDSPASDSPDASEAFLADLLDIIHAQVDRTNRKRDAGNTAKSLDAAMGRAGGSRA
ncbi:TPA: hypothetical protein ACH3X2_000526 [Trebouxia sp. C0005]